MQVSHVRTVSFLPICLRRWLTANVGLQSINLRQPYAWGNELNAQVTWQQYPGNGVGIMVDTNYPPSGSTEGSRALKIAGHTQSNSIKHNHYINLDTEPGGSHNHEIKTNTNNSGGGNSHENLPPYYALYYIMKL